MGYRNLKLNRIIHSLLSLTASTCLLSTAGSLQITHAYINYAFIEETDNRITKEKVLDKVKPMESDSTFIGTLHPMLKAAGDEWTIPRLTGIFGHAFSFSMKIGDAAVWQQANIDWWLLWDMLPQIGYEFHEFQIVHHGKETAPSQDDIDVVKEQTWTNVKRSIDQGVPVIAWQPMTNAQKEKGVSAYGWGLLVGYDERKKTYTVRHQNQKTEYAIPFDQFGYTDPVGWYCVFVLGNRKLFDERKLVVRSLENAVAFANGKRFDLAEAPYKVDAVGFAAYQLWKKAVVEGDVDLGFIEHSAWILWEMRENAAEYLREIAVDLPTTSSQILLDATKFYDTEIKAIAKLVNLCKENESFTELKRQEAAKYIGTALDAEQKAIGKIEEALKTLSKERNKL